MCSSGEKPKATNTATNHMVNQRSRSIFDNSCQSSSLANTFNFDVRQQSVPNSYSQKDIAIVTVTSGQVLIQGILSILMLASNIVAGDKAPQSGRILIKISVLKWHCPLKLVDLMMEAIGREKI